MPWGFSVLISGARFSQNGPLQRKAGLLNIPESFASNVLPSPFTPVFPGCPPRTAVRFDPDSYGDFALPWDSVHVKVCVRLLRMGSLFPPLLWSSCTQVPGAFNTRCSRGSFSQCQIPAHESSMWGSELSLLWVSLCEPVSFQSVELPTWEVWGFLYHEITPPTS